MAVQPEPVATLEVPLVRIALAAALGLFLGLEREWSHKTAGVRTFSLVSLMGAVFTVLADEPTVGPSLLVVGGVLVVVQGVLLAVRRLIEDEEGLALTTSASLLVAYGVGVLVGRGYIVEGVAVAVLSSLLLVLKRELHTFAWGLTREELRSVTEFAILAFVVFPLLPADPVEVGQGSFAVTVEPQVVWLMVVTVAGIGIVNYAIVQNYGGRGIAVTGFFGGLASSTAVVGTMLDHVRQYPDASEYAAAAILLANAAMAARNLTIAVAFTLTAPVGVLTGAVVPLGTVVVGALAIALFSADWSHEVEMSLESPFSLRNALAFGGLFMIVIVAGALAQARFGTVGFFATAAAMGLVSSAGATTAAIVLYRTQALAGDSAVFAILLATAMSIVVKGVLTGIGGEHAFARRVALTNGVLLVLATVVTAVVVL